MVTSNKQADKKVFKMAEQGTAAVVPQRTLLGEVNGNITCPLCRGYYIDATTIVECLHSFCRSCIIKHLQVKSYCPVCEMMINSAKPNIKLDKALQDIVYKLVPGLFQKEMERRQQFYASRPGPAASATPEQRGEDTERIIFSPEDVISFSLEYADATDSDSISSKSSDSNEPQLTTTRRYLQCPAVVNINHLKKFLSMKFDIDSTQFAIDILYKRVPLPDYYTLMDIAYIYNWKRNEPMRFFYQIIDYVAIRNRLFEVNRKDTAPCLFRKSSPASTEDTNVSSPALHLNDEVSSGTDSPMPDENVKQCIDASKKNEKPGSRNNESVEDSKTSSVSHKKNDDEVEKSQFLNSFELTAKNSCTSKSPVKGSDDTITSDKPKVPSTSQKEEEKTTEPTKRKQQVPPQAPEFKKFKIEIDKAKLTTHLTTSAHSVSNLTSAIIANKPQDKTKAKEADGAFKCVQPPPQPQNIHGGIPNPMRDIKTASTPVKSDIPGVKRAVSGPSPITSPKRKLPNEGSPLVQAPSGVQKTMSPIKHQSTKPEGLTNVKLFDTPKSALKKMPDLKPSGSIGQSSQNKAQPVNKVRMDLLANNSDPTIDRSKILSQVKSSLGTPAMQSSGDPLKSLFDSCKINIPSSLSITLTDQKLEGKPDTNVDPKKSALNKSLSTVTNTSHKVPSPPVHNYIEILKLPDVEAKAQAKSENNTESKPTLLSKPETTPSQSKPSVKSSEGSAKGPVPNLKPISDTKLAKQSGNYTSPITFQQTFEQQLQSLQTDKKPKLPKNKAQVPKLVPATPKSLGVVNKSPNPVSKTASGAGNMPSLESKSTAALDLTTPHTVQTQIGQQQTFNKKAFEAMQSIDSLTKKQNLPTKAVPHSMAPSNSFSSTMSNRPLQSSSGLLRIPSTPNMHQLKQEKNIPGSVTQMLNRHDNSTGKANQLKSNSNNSPTVSPSYQMTSHTSPSTAQPSPRSQTRSPSSSPKLVIAEEKQTIGSSLEQNMNQSNQVTSTQISSLNISNNDAHKPSPGPSTKSTPKPMAPAGKLPGMLQPMNPTLKSKSTMNPSAAEYLMSQTRAQLMPHHHVLLRHQMEVNAWFKAQRQLDMIKNMSNMAHQGQSDFNNKDKS